MRKGFQTADNFFVPVCMSFTNIESTQIAHLVGVESAAFTESVSKMSSGKRLLYPAMDAAGLSMEVKLSSSGERHKLAMQNMLRQFPAPRHNFLLSKV